MVVRATRTRPAKLERVGDVTEGPWGGKCMGGGVQKSFCSGAVVRDGAVLAQLARWKAKVVDRRTGRRTQNKLRRHAVFRRLLGDGGRRGSLETHTTRCTHKSITLIIPVHLQALPANTNKHTHLFVPTSARPSFSILPAIRSMPSQDPTHPVRSIKRTDRGLMDA